MFYWPFSQWITTGRVLSPVKIVSFCSDGSFFDLRSTNGWTRSCGLVWIALSVFFIGLHLQDLFNPGSDYRCLVVAKLGLLAGTRNWHSYSRRNASEMSQWSTIDFKTILYQVIDSNVRYSCAVSLQILSGPWNLEDCRAVRQEDFKQCFCSPLVLHIEWVEPTPPLRFVQRKP